MASASLQRKRWDRWAGVFALAIGMVVAAYGCVEVDLNVETSTERPSVVNSEEMSSSTRTTNSNLIQLELRPTSSLVEKQRRRRIRERQRRLAGRIADTNISSEIAEEEEKQEDLPAQWFHPYSRAVYATLHPPDVYNDNDGDDDNDEKATLAEHHYHDFVKYRHLSRFERHFRESLGLNLHPHWTGNYSDPTNNFIELHDPTVLLKEILGDAERTTTTTAITRTSSENRTVDPQRRPLRHDRRHRELLESLIGGKFDQYQGVPLSQGYGTHYVHLWVGSPVPQRQSVIVDTGSHFTGFPVARECKNCGEGHHTDPHFDPTRSETFRTLRCPTECLETYECESTSTTDTTSSGIASTTLNDLYNKNNNYPRCTFSQAYTEGSSWTAYQARDIVYCGGGADLIEAVDPLDIKYSLSFVFGCLKANTGLFVTQLADGIMGMSAHELTLPKQLYNERKIEYNMFAMCFRKELGTSKKGVTAGSMTLGGVSSALDTSPMVYARNIRPYGWYTVYVENIFLATNGGTKFLFDDASKSISSILEENAIVPLLGFDSSMVNRDRGVIVDSGTTDTYLCSSIRQEFARVWKEATGMEYSNSAAYLTQSQLKKLPTLLVQLQASGTVAGISPHSNTTATGVGNKPVLGQVGYLDPDHRSDVLLSIPATSYMEYSPTFKVYTSRLFFTESRGGVIGANSMQGHNVLFDWQHGRIGFAQSSCSYDLIAGKNDNHGDFGGSGGVGSFVAATSSNKYPCVFLDQGRLPILTQTCLHSVSNNPSSMAICMATESPTNVEVEGLEIWTLRIEDPGSDPSGCEAAILEWSDSIDTHNQIDPSTTSCTLDGLCQEYRPCHVPCLTAIDYHRYHQERSNGQNGHASANVKSDASSAPLDEAVTIPHAVVNRTAVVDGREEDPSGVANPCKDWMWTACDHSCHQSRISSAGMVTHVNGRYCVELERKSRSCHVQACGRSDPCIVPFLVHAIFVLEGRGVESGTGGSRESPIEPLAYWTPQVEEDFRRSLVLAAHHPDVYEFDDDGNNRGTLLFEEGDVDILVARPWYGDQDETGEESDGENETSRSNQNKDYDGGKESLGIQLILQISISNPKAISKQLGGRGRILLQEVGVVWSNFTRIFRRSRATSVCNPFDLYPLAKTANLVADEILTNPRFLSLLVTENRNNLDDDDDDDETHRLLRDRFKKGLKGFRSARLISSWTIGTQIYDDSVNYLGPLASTPLFPIIKLLHEAFFFILALWVCKLLVCLSKSIRLCRVCGIRLKKKWYPNQDDPDNNEDFEMSLLLPSPSFSTNGGGVGASSEVELAATYLGSKATKRTNSTTATLSDGAA
jgi:hypothetical protein